MPDPSLLQRLKERKLIQWALAYLAGAWALVEASNLVVDQFHWPEVVGQVVTVAAFFGFFVALVVAWYHGEKGRQRVSGPELLMVAALLVIAGGVLSMLGPESRTVQTEDQPAGGEIEGVAEELSRLPGIAVLPFENRSGVPDDQYFTDGFHDELLTRLQRTSGLRVVSRTSVEAYRDTLISTPQIARALGVAYILEGGVQRSGDWVRINLQLIAAQRDAHVWAATYDREITPGNLFDVQSEVVAAVAGELDVTLRDDDRERAARRTASDPVAYDLYMRGWDSWKRGSVFGAARLFREAAEYDSTFLLAHAMTSESQAWIYSTSERTQARADLARESAERALALDSASEDAQMAMGWYFYYVDRDYANALSWFARASGTLRGDPRYHQAKAYMERRTGQWRAAVASLERAATLSPGSATPGREMATTLLRMRRYSEVERWLQECMALPQGVNCGTGELQLQWMRDGLPSAWPGISGFNLWQLRMVQGDPRGSLSALDAMGDATATGRWWLPKELLRAWSYEHLGDTVLAGQSFSRAASILEEKVREDSQDERYHAALGLAYAGMGRRDDAVREATAAVELLPVDRDTFSGPHQLFTLAVVYARFGEVQEALDILERLLTIPSEFSAAKLRTHYLLTPLHEDPSFLNLMEREPGSVF